MKAVARKRYSLACALIAAVWTGPATAGTSEEPEITDTAGDANFLNGQGVQSGLESGPDTRPVSVDGSDLLAVWFETEYATSRVVDPETGSILRVEYEPTSLLVHIRTQGPIHPTPPRRSVRYAVTADLPDCRASFTLQAYEDPSQDRVTTWAITTGCGQVNAGAGVGSPVDPSFDGSLSTISFPLSSHSQFIKPGSVIDQPKATVDSRAHINYTIPTIDESPVGQGFVIGEDVPADIDCEVDPEATPCN